MIHESVSSFMGMHMIWWLFWILLITTAFTAATPVPRSLLRSGEGAIDILTRRYAAGELSSADYERRRAVLERDEPAAGAASHTH